MKKSYQRDSFINQIFKIAKKNKNIYFLSADFGAPSLDIFRKKLPKQFIHTGISEQIVINYAMAPFILSRAWEQHKIGSLMKLPMINLVPGVGYGYANAGPTHYSNEDLGLANLIVGSNIYTTADSQTAKFLAKYIINDKSLAFVRLDREKSVDINYSFKLKDFKNGYRVIFRGKKICIISHGHLLNKLWNIIKEEEYFRENITLIDLFRCKPISENLSTILEDHFHTLVFDEQYENFNLANLLLNFVNKYNLNNKIVCNALSEKIDFGNDGREALLHRSGLSSDKIKTIIEKYI